MKIGKRLVPPAQLGIFILALVTALIHVSLGEVLFILNGLGFIALLAIFFIPFTLFRRYHQVVRWLFVGYVVLTIALYFASHSNGSWQEDGLGVMTKMIEVILALLLVYDGQVR